MTLQYINKIHFNRGQDRLPCILLLLGNKGCYVIQSKYQSDLEKSIMHYNSDVNYLEKWQW